jgi:ABC-type Fe3+/spermidine/putrescine transport system ATPase subunit
MPEIVFKNVSKTYGNVKAVINLNFTIYDGEYISLLGPSGCGKTTTLRMLSGLIIPSKGEILWDDKPVQDLPPDQRDIGYVFQQFAIFPHMNIWENVAYSPQVKGYSKKEIEIIVEDHLKLVGLHDKAQLFANQLDASDLQRVGVARVLASGARTLLLDEPFGALDHKIREQFQDEVRQLVKKLGLTAIHVTHDQSEGMAISDRIGVMKKGKMIQLGTPEELLFSPSHIFTAHFIGESNFLEGILVENGSNGYKVELYSGEVLSVTNAQFNPMIGEQVILSFRKEFFKFKNNEESNIISGKIISDIYLGEKRRITFNMKYNKIVELISHPKAPVFEEENNIEIYLDPKELFLFKYPRSGLENVLEVT